MRITWISLFSFRVYPCNPCLKEIGESFWCTLLVQVISIIENTCGSYVLVFGYSSG